MPPRLPSTAIPRDELLARLDVGLTKKVCLVTAPAGFGKTTLVRMWIANRDFRSAWVTLDENDNDPTRFWTYVVSAVRTFDPSVGKNTLSALMTTQPPSFQTLLTSWINDLARLKEPCVLVLEDYHSVSSAEISKAVSFLIQHLPEALHLVLIARVDPELPLPTLRVRDELVEINAANLRFTQAETESFLSTTMHSDFPSSLVSRLLQKTQGWAAGLRLLALSLQNKSDVDIERLMQTFSGSDRYVADYLIKEVFEGQPENIRSFLLKTCFFNRLTGSLCDEITETNESAVTLERLARDNLFIEQLEHEGNQTWYRYNPLFAESIQFLARQRLEYVSVETLFEKASNWYEYHELLDEAIETALTARLCERAILLVKKFIEIHDITQWQTLVRWLEKIPEELILRYPTVCFAYAQVTLYASDRFAPATLARIEPLLRAAEETFLAEENHKGFGEVLSFRGIAHWWQGNFQKAFEYARRSLEELPEDDLLYRGTSLLTLTYEALNTGRILEAQDKALEARALLGAAQNIFGVLGAVQMLSEIFFWQGELEQSEQLNQQILIEAVGDESMLDDQGIASLTLAHISYERNDLDQAERFAARALDLGGQRANEMLQMQATVQLAYLHAARGDPSRARDLVKSFETKIQGPVFLREIQNAQALLAIRANDFSALDWWVKIVSVVDRNALHMQKEREAFTLARLKIAEGETKAALDLIDEWKEGAVQNGRIRSRVEALCLEALAYHADNNLPETVKALGEALTIGNMKGFRRTFLDEGTRMAATLQAILPSLPNRTLSLFATTLLHSFPAEATAQLAASSSTVQVEALSQQELRVLRLLVAGLPNADIAQELVLSVNTIKTHVKSIYRKLNVKSRDEAREVARELKLL
jgi:LuxR family maltose regulon positive regulatory protein